MREYVIRDKKTGMYYHEENGMGNYPTIYTDHRKAYNKLRTMKNHPWFKNLFDVEVVKREV